MQAHRIGNFFGPGLAMCDRCERVVDVYEWSEPCEVNAALEGAAAPAGSHAHMELIAS
jgi:hypothetical protein